MDEHRQVEHALSLREIYLTAIIENQPGLVWLKDAEGRFQMVNGAFARACGKEVPGQVLGKTDLDIWPAELARKYMEDDQKVMQERKSYHVEEPISDQGRIIWFETFKTPIFNEARQVIGTSGFARDITERKQMESSLKKAKEEAETATKAKSDFLNNIAHDLRTPMHAIMGFSAFLQSESMTEKQKKFAKIINERSAGLLRLVEDLLDVSRLEAGRLELRSMVFEPGQCVAEAVETARVELMGKDIKISSMIDEGLPRVLGDEVRFNQILTNLLSNAVKYTDKGAIVVRIDHSWEDRPEGKCRLRLSVKDTGLGIAQDRQAHIFDAFTQFHEFEGGKQRGGVGLGMYITKTLVDMMQGQITLISEVGVGSEFVVTLQLACVTSD